MNGRPRGLELGAGAISLATVAGSLWIGPGCPWAGYSGGLIAFLDVGGSYDDAWISGKGDFSAVPLAPDFAFTGPVASFDTAEGFRELAAQAGPIVNLFGVPRQFT